MKKFYHKFMASVLTKNNAYYILPLMMFVIMLFSSLMSDFALSQHTDYGILALWLVFAICLGIAGAYRLKQVHKSQKGK